MSETSGVILMMNNYFHDVATALLVASGFAAWIIYRQAVDKSSKAQAEYFLAIYRSMSRLALFALAGIIIGGIPRTIFYKDFEWSNAAGRGQVTALAIKHVFAFAFVGAGVVMWIGLRKKAGEIRAGLEDK